MNIYLIVAMIVIFLSVISFSAFELTKKKKPLRKVILSSIIIFTVGLIICAVCVILFTKPEITLKGDNPVIVKVGEKYTEPGYKVKYFYKKSDNKLNIDSKVDTNVVGEYEVKYSVKYLWKTIGKTRVVKVIDDIDPTIELEGKDITIYNGAKYVEPGYKATDNYDGDITDKVEVINNIDDNPGTYDVIYKVSDSSGNMVNATRSVIRKNEIVGTIYFTFDDGPSNSTESILNILKKYNIKATFFVTGSVASYESMIKRMKEEGHTVALHSYTHNYNQIYASETAYYNDLNAVSDAVYNIIGEKSTIVRFPGGSSNTVSRFNPGIMSRLAKSLNNNGYHYFDWNVDSSDAWSAKDKNDVYNNVINGIRRGGNNVVLMHDKTNNQKTVDALESIINKLIETGYAFEPITMDTPVVHHGLNN